MPVFRLMCLSGVFITLYITALLHASFPVTQADEQMKNVSCSAHDSLIFHAYDIAIQCLYA